MAVPSVEERSRGDFRVEIVAGLVRLFWFRFDAWRHVANLTPEEAKHMAELLAEAGPQARAMDDALRERLLGARHVARRGARNA